MSDKLQKFKEIVDILDKDVPSTKEVADLIATIIQVVKEAKEHLEKQAEMHRGEMSSEINQVISDMEMMEEKMTEMHAKMEKKMSGEMDEMVKKIYTELTKVKNLIPKEVDFSEIYDKISEVEKKIVPVEEIKAEDIVDKINASEKLIDKERIKGLEDEIKNLRKEISTKSAGGSPRRIYQPYVDDFSGDTNGSTKIFYLSREPLKAETVLVWGSDFPIILRPTTDFTIAGKKLTLTSAVPSPSLGATLLVRYDS